MLTLPRRFTRHSMLLSAVAAACAGFASPCLVRADTTATWTTNANSAWSNAADWSTNPIVPNNSGGTLYDVVINSGTVALDISPEIQLLNFSNATLNGTNTLTIDGLMTWSNNAVVGAPILAKGGISIAGSNVYIAGGTVTNTATTTLNQSTLHFVVNGATPGVFLNNGTFNAVGNAGIIINDSGTNNVFINNGLMTSSITGTFNIAGGFAFVNNGTLSVASGTTLLGANETGSTGTYLVTTGATLNFNGGNHTFLSGANFAGQGNVMFTSGGTTTLAGANYGVTGTTTLTNGYLNSVGTAAIGGVLDLNNSEILGTIVGNGGITMISTNAYIGGTLTNSAGQSASLSQSSLHLQTVGGNAGYFINNGSFNASGSAGNIFNDSGTANAFINNGVMTSSITGIFNIAGGYAFINNGTLNVTAGTTLLGANETASSGTYLIAAGATLNLNNGNHTFLPAAIISGAGNVSFTTSGTTTLAGSNYNISGTTTLTNGYLNTSTPTTLSGVLDINNGEILGNVTANGGLTITSANAYVGGGTLTNAAGKAATLSQSSLHMQVIAGQPSFFINNGSFNASGSAGNIFNDSGTANAFINNGVMTSSITGNFNIAGGYAFINNGTLNVTAGTTLIGANETASSGTYLIAAGATLNLNNGNHAFLPAAIISGAGSVLLTTSGTTTLAGANYSVTGTTNLSNGYLDTSAPTSIGGLLDINNGEILGNIAANAGLTMTSTNAYVGGGTLTNAAGQNAALSQSSLHLATVAGRPAFFINNGTFNATGTAGNIFNDSGTANVFSNNGAFVSNVSGNLNLVGGYAFNNAGTVSANAGTVTISSGGAHTGAFIQNGGKILFNGGTNNFNAGSSILVLNVAGGRVVFNAGAAITPGGSMTLTGGTTVLASGPNLPTKLTSLTITNNNAVLDVTTSKLIVQAANSTDKATRLTSFNTSMGVGAITSSTATADSNHLGVGLFDNAILNLTTFGGTTSVDANSILIAVAHLGDANRDGVVDIQDQSIVTNNWQQPRNNWAAGDLNHDGFVDIQDLTIVTNNWQQTSSFSQSVSQLEAGDSPNIIIASVPEPSSLVLLAASALLLPTRFRKRKNHPPAERHA